MANVSPTSLDEELKLGSYNVCPAQFESQSAPGRNKSLAPVSKATVCYRVNFSHGKLPVPKRRHTSVGNRRGTHSDGTVPEMGIVIGEWDTVASLG